MKNWYIVWVLVSLLLSFDPAFSQTRKRSSMDSILVHAWTVYNNSAIGNLGEVLTSLTTCINNRDTGTSTAELMEALIAKGFILLNSSDYAQSLDCAVKAMDLSRETSDSLLLVPAYLLTAKIFMGTGETERAERNIREGIRLALKFREFDILADLYHAWGCYYRTFSHDTARAMMYYKKGMEIAVNQRKQVSVAAILNSMGELSQQHRDFLPAGKYLDESIRISRETNTDLSLGQALLNSAILKYNLAARNLEAGSAERSIYQRKALEAGTEALMILRRQSRLSDIKKCYEWMSEMAYQQQEYEKSLNYIRKAWDLNDTVSSFANQRRLSAVENRLLQNIHEKELELIDQKTNNNRIIIILLSVVLAFTFISIFLVVRSRKKVNELLLNVLPASVAGRLQQKEHLVADSFESVTVLLFDIVNFTSLADMLPPGELVNLLNKVYTEFDKLASQYKLEKVKTIGDCYFVAAGLPDQRPDHAKAAAGFALEAMKRLQQTDYIDDIHLKFRCGIDCGPVVAGVIGEKKYAYDLWGEVVEGAKRLEEKCEPGKIHVSRNFYDECMISDPASQYAGMKPEFVRASQSGAESHGQEESYYLENITYA